MSLFQYVIELVSHSCWRLHQDIPSSIDALLGGTQPDCQRRQRRGTALTVQREAAFEGNAFAGSAFDATSSWLADL